MLEAISASSASAVVLDSTATAVTALAQTDATFWSSLLTNPVFVIVFPLAYAAWILLWKGWALWRASQKNQKVWFIILLVFNTLGLLEIAYLFFFSRQDWSKIGARFGFSTATSSKKNSSVKTNKKEK